MLGTNLTPKLIDMKAIKETIRTIVKNNNLLKNFELRDNRVQNFNTVNSFGLKIIELLSDSDVINISIGTVEQKGYYGQDYQLDSILKMTKIVKISFQVHRKSNKINKNDFGSALKNDWGTTE